MMTAINDDATATTNNEPPQQHRPYKAQIHLALPSATHARIIKDAVSVDGELKDNIIKTFDLVTVADVPPAANDDARECQRRTLPGIFGDDESGDDDEKRVLKINFEATDAKTLRVVVSTTYDMIHVALKCFQEFE